MISTGCGFRMGRREETNPQQVSVLHMGTQYLLFRTDNRFTLLFCPSWRAVLGFDSRFLCDISFLFFPKSTATHRNHMKCVCDSFILVVVVQIVHTKKPRLTSTLSKMRHTSTWELSRGCHHRYLIYLEWGRLCLPHDHSNLYYYEIACAHH